MNDFYNKVETIKRKFTEAGYKNLSDLLLDLQVSGGTPGEVFAGIAYNLNKIRIDQSEAYKHAENEINEIIQYAKKINYIE